MTAAKDTLADDERDMDAQEGSLREERRRMRAGERRDAAEHVPGVERLQEGEACSSLGSGLAIVD